MGAAGRTRRRCPIGSPHREGRRKPRPAGPSCRDWLSTAERVDYRSVARSLAFSLRVLALIREPSQVSPVGVAGAVAPFSTAVGSTVQTQRI